MLSLLSFNWIGYRLLLSYAENREDRLLESSLDRQEYDASQLVSLKFPVDHFSAYVNARGFQRADGQLEWNGVCYSYVKIRLYNDSLELLCIPNRARINLQRAEDNFFKLINDLQQKGSRNQGAHLIKMITAYYILTGFQMTSPCLPDGLSGWPVFTDALAGYSYLPEIDNPPERTIPTLRMQGKSPWALYRV